MKNKPGMFVVGIAIGVAMGVALHNVAVGIALGAAVGLAFSGKGSCAIKKNTPEDKL